MKYIFTGETKGLYNTCLKFWRETTYKRKFHTKIFKNYCYSKVPELRNWIKTKLKMNSKKTVYDANNFTSSISKNMWNELLSLKFYNILRGTNSTFVTGMFDWKCCKKMKKKKKKKNRKYSPREYWAMFEGICFNINFQIFIQNCPKYVYDQRCSNNHFTPHISYYFILFHIISLLPWLSLNALLSFDFPIAPSPHP